MERLRSVIQMLLAAITFLVVGSAMTGVWQNFARGASPRPTCCFTCSAV